MDSNSVSASSKGNRSSAATSQSGVTVAETKWHSILALMLSASALVGFVLLNADRQEDRRWWDREFRTTREQLIDTQVASKLTERRYIDIETYALLNGWKVPADDQHGPLGNLERMKGERK